MAPLPVIPGVKRVAMRWNCLGQTAVNVIHIATTNEVATAEATAQLFQDHATVAMWNILSLDAKLQQLDVTPLDGGSATVSHVLPDAAPFHGVGDGDFLPSSAVLIKLTTAIRGKSYRGRIFLPFPPETSVANGSITVGSAGTLGAAWAAFGAALVTDATTPAHMVVASYKLATATPVIAWTGEVVLGTQRRRQTRLRV
jgi:hypothetical protein